MDLEQVGVPLVIGTAVGVVTRRWWQPRLRTWWRRRKLKGRHLNTRGILGVASPKGGRDLDV